MHVATLRVGPRAIKLVLVLCSFPAQRSEILAATLCRAVPPCSPLFLGDTSHFKQLRSMGSTGRVKNEVATDRFFLTNYPYSYGVSDDCADYLNV